MEDLFSNIFIQLMEINIFKDVFVPIAALVTGVLIATRKFKNEQVWKEKYIAYQKVIQSFESIAHWASETKSDVYLTPGVGSGDVSEEYVKAQREIIRHAAIGSLQLSTEFLNQLEAFKLDFFRERFEVEEEYCESVQERDMLLGRHANNVQVAVGVHLPKLIAMARRDLGASASFDKRIIRQA